MLSPLAFYIYIYISVLSDELWWHSLSVYSLVQVEFCSRKILNLSISSAMTQLLWHHFAFSDFNQLSLSHPTSLWWDKYQLAELYRSILKEGKCLKIMCFSGFFFFWYPKQGYVIHDSLVNMIVLAGMN